MTTPQPKLTIVRADEWQGLYVDGKLVYENHSVDAEDVLKALGIEEDYFNVNDEWLENQGGLPALLEDIPKRVIE